MVRMRDDHWTLLLVRGNHEALRQISVTGRFLRRVGWGLGASAVLALVAVGVLAAGGLNMLDSLGSQGRDGAMAAELERLQSQVVSLESTLGSLQGREAELRALAGLEPLDAEVLAAGIGGPGAGSPESNALFSVDPELGNRAFAVDYDIEALQRRARVLLESMAEAGDSLASQKDLLMSTPTLFPTAGSLSSGFSKARMHPILNEVLPHPGVDIAAPSGTPILASGKGRVIRAGGSPDMGRPSRSIMVTASPLCTPTHPSCWSGAGRRSSGVTSLPRSGGQVPRRRPTCTTRCGRMAGSRIP